MRKLLVFFTLLVFCQAGAQQFGGNPGYIHWRQINTDVAKVLYPDGLDSIAQRVASITSYLQKNYSQTIGGKIRKITIVLQGSTSVTNGYVALAPFRSEFYLMPPQSPFDLGAQNWADNLSIHEFRHVQQYSNFNSGVSKILSVLFGEQGQDFGNSTAIPNWFFEGDAVYNETMLSHQGRGRLPAFLAGFRSIYDEGKHYTYMQIRNGSLQHQLPDWYPLGYMLVAYGREKYGNDFWLKVTADAAAFKPLIYPFQNAVEKYAGTSFKDFVNDAFRFYQTQWKADSVKNTHWLTAVKKNNVIDYKYPYLIEDGSLLVLKGSYTDIPRFTKLLPNGKEQKIAVRDVAYDDYFSYNSGKIIYGSYKADSRWGYKDYSVIKILDIATRTTKTIDNKTKYFSPDISHNSEQVVAVKMEAGLKSVLVLFDTAGKILKQWNNKEALLYSYPKFSADDQYIYIMVRNNRGMMGINKLNILDGSITPVLGLSNRVLGFPVVQGDTLLYTSSNNGYDETWAYVASQNANFHLARFATGLYQAVFNGQHQLVASAYTADGYRIASFTPQWQPVTTADTLVNQYVTHPFNSFDNNTLVNVKNATYPSTKYPKASHPLNFHSYRPFYDYPNTSITLYGENVLETVSTQLSYAHNNNEGYNQFAFGGVYGGTYVQPVVNIAETFNRTAIVNGNTPIHWNELNLSGGLQLPLNFSSGKLSRSLTLTSLYDYDQVSWTGIAKGILPNTGIHYLQNSIEYISQVQQATKQIYPSWAQTVLLQYRGAIDKNTAHQFLGIANFYLPGLAKTNSLVISLAYQARDTAGEYYYTNNFPTSRGYSNIDYPRMWKVGGNYHFPIAYPDWGVGNIVFLQRIRANLFFDYTGLKSLRYQTIYNLNSTGAELYIDTKLWNELPATFGFRYSKLLNGGGGLFEVLIPALIIN